VTLYHDRASGQRRCRQHRRALACDQCGAGGVALLMKRGRKLCRTCQSAPAPAAPAASVVGDRLDDLRAAFPLSPPASPLDRPSQPGPVTVTLPVTLDPRELQALQALRLGEPLRQAARHEGLSPTGLKGRLGRAVIAAWLARTR